MEQVLTYSTLMMCVLLLVYCHRIVYFYRGLSRLTSGINNKKPNVCVIIPARNEEHTIGQCLASLQSQRYPQELLHVIVVDDYSTDRTMHAATAIAASSHIPITVISVHEFADITSEADNGRGDPDYRCRLYCPSRMDLNAYDIL